MFTRFECLANEIIYEIFDYLDSIFIFCAFYNLNQRFQQFILPYTWTIDLTNVSYSIYHYYYSQIAGNFHKNVRQLKIGGEKASCQQLNMLTLIPLGFHPNLTSLSVSNIPSHSLLIPLNQILLNNQQLKQLSIKNVYFKFLVTTTITHLTICLLTVTELFHLFDLIPCVQYLNTQLKTFDDGWDNIRLEQKCQDMKKKLPNLNTFHLHIENLVYDEMLRLLLENLQHLTRLSLLLHYCRSPCFYLPVEQYYALLAMSKLEKLEFLITFGTNDESTTIDTIINLFKTNYFLDKKLIVGCHLVENNYYVIYSLPYSFSNIELSNKFLQRQTNIETNEKYLWKQVTNIKIILSTSLPSAESLLNTINLLFPNVIDLQVNIADDNDGGNLVTCTSNNIFNLNYKLNVQKLKFNTVSHDNLAVLLLLHYFPSKLELSFNLFSIMTIAPNNETIFFNIQELTMVSKFNFNLSKICQYFSNVRKLILSILDRNKNSWRNGYFKRKQVDFILDNMKELCYLEMKPFIDLKSFYDFKKQRFLTRIKGFQFEYFERCCVKLIK